MVKISGFKLQSKTVELFLKIFMNAFEYCACFKAIENWLNNFLNYSVLVWTLARTFSKYRYQPEKS